MSVKESYLKWLDCLAVLSVGLVLRCAVSLWPYSGAGKPPIFGDYEAQRHWQEITLNLPAVNWYSNSSENDLLYWGLDYPPLTAMHSYLLGRWAEKLNSSYVALGSSRGHESSAHKTFMRTTVLLADVLILLPACVQYVRTVLDHQTKSEKGKVSSTFLQTLIVLVLYPGLILIDNGHFQYNNISLGLFLWSVIALGRQSLCKAAVLFTLALNYKQMELYHAVPIFLYLLRACFFTRRWSLNLPRFLSIGAATVITFSLLWLPWLSSFEYVRTVIGRLFPLQRGLYEDKVANFWCSLNILYKIRNNLPNNQIVWICLTVTLMAIVPTSLHNFYTSKWRILLYSLFNTALAFFLFSFQVHEKSILLVALPMACLYPFEGFRSITFLHLSVFSLYPLLIKDGLVIPYYVMLIAYHLICAYILPACWKHSSELRPIINSINLIRFQQNTLIMLILSVSLLALYIDPPRSLPYIWPTIISLFSAFGFILYAVIGNYLQFKDVKLIHNIPHPSKGTIHS